MPPRTPRARTEPPQARPHPLTVQGITTIERLEQEEENAERFEALLAAKLRLAIALEQAIEAHKAIQSTGLAPAHILEPLRTVVDLTRQSHARVMELLTRVPR
jgi:hypothetical protein